jgi:hypothetical protein
VETMLPTTPAVTATEVPEVTTTQPLPTTPSSQEPELEGCDEIMTDPVLFPDDMLEFVGPVQEGSSVSDARPTGSSVWKSTIPEDDSAEKPALKITLPTPGPVEKFVIPGTWKTAEIKLQSGETTFTAVVENQDKPIVVADLRDGASKAPENVETVTITILSAQEDNTVEATVKVWACVTPQCK